MTTSLLRVISDMRHRVVRNSTTPRARLSERLSNGTTRIKGFGFVELTDGSGDAFLHVSVVERSGHGSVPPGATLEVRAGPGPKGPQVTEILSVDASTAMAEQPRRARPERPAYAPAGERATAEEIGTVKWYNAIKGFGFVGPDRGGKDIFVHASALERSGLMGLAEGQRVAVDVADGQKGPEAVSVRLA